jgi:hypothetical protein
MKKFLTLGIPVLALFVGVFFLKRHFPSPFPAEKEKLSVSFISYVTQVKGSKKIQLVEVRSNEVIERTSEFSLFWDQIRLPDIVVLARVPTLYTYYVDLEEPFTIENSGTEIRVHAPPLRSGTPAPDVSAISYEVKKGSLLRSSQTAFQELQKTITPLLWERAERNKALGREDARKQLQELVKSWIGQTEDPSVAALPLHVVFEDEEPASFHP